VPPEAERVRLATEVARGLAMAVSAHRLYPDDETQPGFVSAYERVVAAARASAGPVTLEVQHGLLLVDGHEVTDRGGSLDRLAAACFERSIEYVEVRAAPTPAELLVVARALSETPEDLDAAGGIEAVLALEGVRALVLAAVHPEAGDEESVLAGLDPSLRGSLLELREPERFVSNVLVAAGGQEATQVAENVLQRFQVLHNASPAETRVRSGFYRDVFRVIEAMPDHIARELLARIVTRIDRDPFSRDLLDQLTDGELVDVVTRLSSGGGPDPLDLAQRLTQLLGHRDDVVRLLELEVATSGPDEGLDVDAVVGSQLRRSTMALARDSAETRIRDALADAAAAALLDASSRDATTLREEWPVTADAVFEVARNALRDYLRVERDVEALAAALERWVVSLRGHLLARDEVTVDVLDRLVAEVEVDAAGDPPRAAAFAVARASIVDDELLDGLIDPAHDEVEASRVRKLLSRFELSSLRSALDRLAVEERPGVRAQLVSLVSGLAPGHIDEVISRTDDPRWYVVRNLVTIMGRTADPQAVTALVSLVRHPEPQVRKELVRALVTAAGGDALPHVRALANDGDPEVRRAAADALAGLATAGAAHALAELVRRGGEEEARHAIDLLASHPSPEAGNLLDGLVSRRSDVRLPSHLRRAAKRAAKERRSR
jgi:hypothetical protein